MKKMLTTLAVATLVSLGSAYAADAPRHCSKPANAACCKDAAKCGDTKCATKGDTCAKQHDGACKTPKK